MDNKNLKNSVFLVMSILGIFAWGVASLFSPFNGNDNRGISIILVLLLVRGAFSLIGTIIGVMLVKIDFNKTLTMKSMILLLLLIVNIVILLSTILILFTLLNFFS